MNGIASLAESDEMSCAKFNVLLEIMGEIINSARRTTRGEPEHLPPGALGTARFM